MEGVSAMRTSMYSILCIVIRLGAVLFAVEVFKSLLNLIDMFAKGSTGDHSILGWSAMFLGLFLVATMLWLFPGPLARLASARSHQQIFESPISPIDLQWIALSVVGVVFAILGILGLVYWLIQGMWIPDTWIVGEDYRRGRFLDGLYYGVQIALGLALSLGAKGLAHLLHRMRYGAIPPTAKIEPSAERVDP
jgi:hypothetical protein